jgi:excisionase family DNA binding protein
MDKVYTVAEVAKILKLSENGVRKLVQTGRLPRIGLPVDRILIPAWALDSYLNPPADEEAGSGA